MKIGKMSSLEESTDNPSDISDNPIGGYDPEGNEWVIAGKKKKASKATQSKTNSTSEKEKEILDMYTTCDACGTNSESTLSKAGKEAKEMHGLMWLCDACTLKFVHFVTKEKMQQSESEEEEMTITERMKIAEEKIANITHTLATIVGKEPGKKIDNKSKETERTIGTPEEQKKKETSTTLEHGPTKENKRNLNIIIHNIPEYPSENKEEGQQFDRDTFYNIAYSLLGNDANAVEVKELVRLGKKKDGVSTDISQSDPKARLLRVTVTEEKHVDYLIRYRTYMKEVGFNNIYLSRDIPPEKREEERKLREELERAGKQTHKIFRGQIIPRQQWI